MDRGIFKENDFVWAKMTGYSHWPGIVAKFHPRAPAKPMKDMQWIYFLGTHNYAWIEERNIKPYHEYKSQYRKKSTEPAMIEMDEIIENALKDPDYKIPFVEYMWQPSPKKSTVKRKSSISSLGELKSSLPLHEKSSPATKKASRPSTSREPDDAIEGDALQMVTDNVCGQDSIVLNTRNLVTSKKHFGFLADNICSEGVIKNLITSGHRLNVWSRSSALCEELQDFAEKQRTWLKICNTPRQVVRDSDITYNYMSDPEQAKSIMAQLGLPDTNDDLLKGKSYVEMTSIDPETSKDFQELIVEKKGLYLEAMLQGNREEAELGNMVVLAGGAQKLFIDCQTCFKAISQRSFLLGKAGIATKMHLILQMMRGVHLTALVESFVMANRCNISLDQFQKIFELTELASDYLKCKSSTIVGEKYKDVGEPLEQLQMDMAQGLEMTNRFKQWVPLASNANEVLKRARRLGSDNLDSACIYKRMRY